MIAPSFHLTYTNKNQTDSQSVTQSASQSLTNAVFFRMSTENPLNNSALLDEDCYFNGVVFVSFEALSESFHVRAFPAESTDKQLHCENGRRCGKTRSALAALRKRADWRGEVRGRRERERERERESGLLLGFGHHLHLSSPLWACLLITP